MKKVRGFLRRFLLCFLAVLCLTFSTAGNVLGLKSMEVYATGTSGLYMLIEALLLSAGVVAGDADGLQSLVELYKEYQKSVDYARVLSLANQAGYDTIEEYHNHLDSSLKSASTVKVSSGLYDSIEGFLGNVLNRKLSSAASSAVSSSVGAVSGITTVRRDFSDAAAIMNEIFYGIQVGYDNQVEECKEIYQGYIDKSDLIIVSDRNGKYLYLTFLYSKDGCITFDEITNGKFNFYYDSRSSYTLPGNYKYEQYSNSGAVSKFGLQVYMEYRNFSNGAELFASNHSAELVSGTAGVASGDSITSRVFIRDGISIYSSFAEYRLLNGYDASLPTFYGASSSAKALEQDDEGNYVVTLPNTSITAQVESSLASAKEANPSITEEELNTVALNVISAQQETTDAVEENTAVLSEILIDIKNKVADIGSSVAVNGTSALEVQEDTRDLLKEQFKVVEGGGGDNNDDDNNKPKRWTPGSIKVPAFLAGLVAFLTSPLQIISDSLFYLYDNISSLPDSIASSMNKNFSLELPEAADYTNPLQNILSSVKALPQSIADSFELPDLVSPLQSIQTSIDRLFVIDTAALQASVSVFGTVWADKIPFGDKLHDFFDALDFSNDYSYPVIKIETPTILMPFYEEQYIVLIDFADYSKYMIWVRNIVKAWIWFCFGLSIFTHLKTDFHIG